MGASCPSVVPFEILLAFEDASFEQLYLQWPFSMIVLTSKCPSEIDLLHLERNVPLPFGLTSAPLRNFHSTHPKNTDSNPEKN